MSNIQQKPEGSYTFTRTSASVITLTPDGLDSACVIWVSDGSEMVPIRLTAALTFDITDTGNPGGVQVAEATSTGYNIYLIWDGTTPALWGVPYGTAIDLGECSGSYTHVSKIIWFSRNANDGDLRDFEDIAGACMYTGREAPINNGKNTAAVGGSTGLVPMAGLIPDDCMVMATFNYCHVGTYLNIDMFILQTATPGPYQHNIGSASGDWKSNTETAWLPVSDPDASWWYRWTGTPTNGIDV